MAREKKGVAAEEKAAIAEEIADINRQLAELDEAEHGKAVCDNGGARTLKSHNLNMVTVCDIEESSPDWLVPNYIPRYQITSLAGDGGSGKTTIWCALAAAISAGKNPFLLNIPLFDPPAPEKVMYFSAEDSSEYTLKRRLRKNGADLNNIYTIDIADDRFQYVKFNDPFLEQLIEKYRPALCIFDPITSSSKRSVHTA